MAKQNAATQTKPNILVIFGDDIGWSNLSCYNHGMMGYKTPNIDRIAKEGAMFTDYYTQQSCTAGRAAFILGDPSKLTPCNKNPGDGCKTPWDVCCDTPEAVKASTVTIQVVGADGKVLKEGIENRNGLKPLSNVTVSGTVTEGSNADVLVLNASAIKVVE